MQEFQIPQPIDAKAKRNALLVVILTSVLFGLLLIPGIGAVMISPVVFDAPDANQNPKLVAFTFALASYPFVTVPAILASWILYALKKYRAATLVSLLPALSLVAGLVCFILLEI
jgi:hypothetical protein